MLQSDVVMALRRNVPSWTRDIDDDDDDETLLITAILYNCQKTFKKQINVRKDQLIKVFILYETYF